MVALDELAKFLRRRALISADGSYSAGLAFAIDAVQSMAKQAREHAAARNVPRAEDTSPDG